VYVDKVSKVDVNIAEILVVCVVFAVITVCKYRSDMNITGVVAPL